MPDMNENTLEISANTWGNFTVTAKWDYLKYDVAGSISALNSGTETDINGADGEFKGYTYNFYDLDAPTVPITSHTFTATAATYRYGTFKASSKPGYQFSGLNIIDYPFASDGSISADTPYGDFLGTPSTTYSSVLPVPLFGASGDIEVSYEIKPQVSGSINIGMEMSLFEHPIYVSVGAGITSFKYNLETYDAS